MIRGDDEARFLSHLTISDVLAFAGVPCRLYDRPGRDGYGQFPVDGRMPMAHRWWWEQHHGGLPPGLDLDHLCHNAAPECPGGWGCPHRACCELSHLDPVSRSVNIHRGQGPRRARALSPPQVAAIRGAWEASPQRRGDRSRIADEMGISVTAVYQILSGRTYRDL